jgi:hypothetical protein
MGNHQHYLWCSGEENRGKEVGEPKTRTRGARIGVQQASTKG